VDGKGGGPATDCNRKRRAIILPPDGIVVGRAGSVKVRSNARFALPPGTFFRRRCAVRALSYTYTCVSGVNRFTRNRLHAFALKLSYSLQGILVAIRVKKLAALIVERFPGRPRPIRRRSALCLEVYAHRETSAAYRVDPFAKPTRMTPICAFETFERRLESTLSRHSRCGGYVAVSRPLCSTRPPGCGRSAIRHLLPCAGLDFPVRETMAAGSRCAISTRDLIGFPRGVASWRRHHEGASGSTRSLQGPRHDGW
jgi:hypothetical protein